MPNPKSKNQPKSNTKNQSKTNTITIIAVITITLIVILITINLLKPILFPFIAGIAIAYFLDPLCDKLETYGLSRTWATSLISLGFFAAISAIIALTLPPLYAETIAFINEAPTYWKTIQNLIAQFKQTTLGKITNSILIHANSEINIADHSEKITAALINQIQTLWTSTTALFNVISLILITPLVSFYLLRDWDKLVNYIDKLTPKQYQNTIRKLANDMDKALSGFVRGQALVCITLATFLSIALTLINVPYGFVIGTISGFLSFIPYLGQLLGAVIAVIIAYSTTHNIIMPASVIAIFITGNIAEGFFLAPRLIGKNIGLHALWVVFALLAAATLFGFIGILIAIPCAALIAVLIRFAIEQYKNTNFYKNK